MPDYVWIRWRAPRRVDWPKDHPDPPWLMWHRVESRQLHVVSYPIAVCWVQARVQNFERSETLPEHGTICPVCERDLIGITPSPPRSTLVDKELKR